MKDVQVEKREWLILDPDGRCYWREGRCGYSDVIGAGLYSTREADGIVAMGRGDKKVHFTSAVVQAALRHAQEGVARFAAALSPRGKDALAGIIAAVDDCTARLYPHDEFETYLDSIVGSTVTLFDDIHDEHAAACIRQLTEAVHHLRRTRDELRSDLVRVALAIREARDGVEWTTGGKQMKTDKSKRVSPKVVMMVYAQALADALAADPAGGVDGFHERTLARFNKEREAAEAQQKERK
jgi:hypothetical protein